MRRDLQLKKFVRIVAKEVEMFCFSAPGARWQSTVTENVRKRTGKNIRKTAVNKSQ